MIASSGRINPSCPKKRLTFLLQPVYMFAVGTNSLVVVVLTAGRRRFENAKSSQDNSPKQPENAGHSTKVQLLNQLNP